MNVPLQDRPRPGRWGKPVDVLPRLPELGRGRTHVGARRPSGGRRLGAVLHRPAAGRRTRTSTASARPSLRRRPVRSFRLRPPLHLPARSPRLDRRPGVRRTGEPSRPAVEVGGQRQPQRSPARTRTGTPGSTPRTSVPTGGTLLGQPVKIFAPVAAVGGDHRRGARHGRGVGHLLAVLLRQLVLLDVVRDRGGRVPEPLRPVLGPRARRPSSVRTSQGVRPG